VSLCFSRRFTGYEEAGKGKEKQSKAGVVEKILNLKLRLERLTCLYKDAVNRKSNQKNLGTIRSSNLCTEIMEYTSPDEVAVI
jgi:ribonucleoside-diphosphate reductase alpha chain